MHTDSRHPPGAPPAGSALSAAPRGRGARGSPQSRFERFHRAPTDDGWFGPTGEPPRCVTTVVDEQARRVLSRNTSPDLPFNLSLNPYRGCEHGCVYCYARPNHEHLGLSAGLDFESRLLAKVNAAERLQAELSAPSYRCEPINLGSATDAYQPVERERRITRAVLEVLARASQPVVVVTKSALIERDLDLLGPMGRAGLAAVYVSVTTLDPALARRWEPRAAAPWRRLETIRRLAEAGIPVGVSASPLVPFLNEPELEQILEAARSMGASHGFHTILRLPGAVQGLFIDWLNAHYPERARRVLARLTDMRDPSGGRALNDSRFHSRMRGRGHWAELIAMRFRLAERRLGLNRTPLNLRTDLFSPPRQDGQLGLFATASMPSAAGPANVDVCRRRS